MVRFVILFPELLHLGALNFLHLVSQVTLHETHSVVNRVIFFHQKGYT